MAEGTFEISNVTFADYGISYIPDVENGHVDPTTKIYLEACNLPQDQITFEANDEGKLMPFRLQDIKLKTENGNTLPSVSEGKIVNGRLVAYSLSQGRRIKVTDIFQDSNDSDKGFVYNDVSGLLGKVLIKHDLPSGFVSGTITAPYVAYIGTKGDLRADKFATAISGAISFLSTAGGPNVNCSVKKDAVYLDTNQPVVGLKIYATGTLSSPLLIEGAKLGGSLLTDELENASFASQIQGILTSSFDNFVEIQSLSSINRLFEDDQFTLSTSQLSFDLLKMGPAALNRLRQSPPTLNSIDSLFNDDKLSNLDNFLYLPPIVKTSDSLVTDKTKIENITPYLLGDYPSWGDNEKRLTYNKIISQVSEYEEPKATVYFDKTSINNRVIGQFFEVTDKTVSKLDVVDFGEVRRDDTESSTSRVFFVGKTYLDDRGTTCFVNMFTLIFSRDTRSESEEMVQ
jgi:hypothetical protein